MSATTSCQQVPSPERRALMTPILGAPRQTTDLGLTHTRPPSATVTSPIPVERVSIVVTEGPEYADKTYH